jgi:hypothetical protein
MLQKRGGDVYAPEVPLKKLFELEDGSVMLTGRADGIIQTEGGYIIDEIKCVNVPVSILTENFCPTHLAQGMCYAYIFASEKGLEHITVRLTYCDISTEEVVKFDSEFDTADLCAFVENMLGEYLRVEHKRLERRKNIDDTVMNLRKKFGDSIIFNCCLMDEDKMPVFSSDEKAPSPFKAFK